MKKQKEIINAEDYIVKHNKGVITNGCFKDYPILTKQSGKGLRYQITICDGKKPVEIITDQITEISHKEVAEKLRQKIAFEVASEIIHAVNRAIEGEELPRNLPNLDYFSHTPEELFSDDDFTSKLAEDVAQKLTDAGKEQPKEVKDLISRGYSNFVLYDLNEKIEKTESQKEAQDKFAGFMESFSKMVK